MNIRDIMSIAPVIPVLIIDKLDHAVPLAEALCAGGLRVLEVTLRTTVALQVVEAMRKAVPDAIVGVGTLTKPEDFKSATHAGAQFGVSPGLTGWPLVGSGANRTASTFSRSAIAGKRPPRSAIRTSMGRAR